MKLNPPMNPVLQNALIMIASGLVASVLCAKVYGATLPVEEPNTPVATTALVATAQTANDDAAAAAKLRAMLTGRTMMIGTPVSAAPRD